MVVFIKFNNPTKYKYAIIIAPNQNYVSLLDVLAANNLPNDCISMSDIDFPTVIDNYNIKYKCSFNPDISVWRTAGHTKIIDLDLPKESKTIPITITATAPVSKMACGICKKESELFTCKACQFKYYGVRA